MTSISRARASLAATALMLVAMAIPGCMEPAAMTCPSGIYCPAGAKCAARQAVCIFDDCGDGILQAGEACDDGNTKDGDGCSADCKSTETCGNGVVDTVMGEVCDDGNTIDGDHCSADCKSKEECGNGSVDVGEDCDGGPSGTADMAKENSVCNWNCTWSSCGDGIVNASDNEQCDDPNGNSNEGDCLTTCKWNVCGDGFLNNSNSANDTEECDEGKRNTDNPNCDYGLKACTICNSSCKPFAGTIHYCGDTITDAGSGEVCDDGPSNGAMSCDVYDGVCPHCKSDCSAIQDVQGPYCGDGITNGHEVCDDRNATATKAACDYGTPFCTLCRDNCGRSEVLKGRYCGDGTPDIGDGEMCDNYASFTCGTCTSACKTKPVNPATGTITVTSIVADGDWFTINDGINDPVTFELDTNKTCVTGHACIDVATANTTAKIATAIQSAIAQEQTAGALVIVATVESNVVVLSNNTPGISGNHDIVVSTTRGALVSGGMEGGVGCPNGGMCKDLEDCVSGACSLNGQCVPK